MDLSYLTVAFPGMDLSYLTVAFPVVVLVCLVLFFRYYLKSMRPLAGTTEWITRTVEKPRFSFFFPRHKMTRKDVLPLLVVVILFSCVDFYRLGDTTDPESFHTFTASSDSAVITLENETYISKIMYYTGLYTGHYDLAVSQDGVNWMTQVPSGEDQYAMDQPYSNLFKWLYADIDAPTTPVTYIRITASNTPLALGEIALYDSTGNLIPANMLSCPAAPELVDEQNIIPAAPSYMNSMYFDEIYHGRTAYENIQNVTPYEDSHPPLGKLIIAVGIEMFGMTPFGWRFMGTLFGVAMLAMLYIFIKNMFGKTSIAVCAALLLGFDFMHYTQTRIATIDTYGVFFILMSYYFMYRYISTPPDSRFRKSVLPLAMSGLFFGIGAASKWIVIYAGAGLVAFYVIHLVMLHKYYEKNEVPDFSRYLTKTLLFSALFFTLIPAIIYCLSYIPYGRADGMTVRGGMLWNPQYYQIIWNNQEFMFHYQSGLVATHPYSARWWQWIPDERPILYYYDRSMENGDLSTFAAFGNPIVWWGGFLAILAMIYRFIKNRDGLALFIVIGYLSQLAPWFFISRITFIYHYFASTIFLVFALAHVFNSLMERKYGRYKLAVYGYTGAAGVVFAMFYPVISGATVPYSYIEYFLRWIPGGWPF